MNILRQRGQAAIVTVLLLVIGASGLFFYLNNPASIALKQDEQTAAALAQAKQALIGYAASHSTRPGALPCPDNNNDGNAESPAPTNCPTYLGRLPWKSLGLPDIRDGNGERLWYALSPNFRNLNPPTGPILNSETAGQITADGTAGVVALLISSGTVLSNQSREAANANTAANYLENGNENGGATYSYTSGNSSSFNDRLMLLTQDQLMPAVELRVAREIRVNLQQYYMANGYYPFAATLTTTTCSNNLYQGRLPTTTPCTPVTAPVVITLPDVTLPSWFVPNEWYKVLIYAVAPRCTPRIDTTPGSIFLWPINLGGGLCTFIPFINLWLCSLPATASINPGALNCNNTVAGSPPGSLLTVGASSNIQALLLSAGAGISPQMRSCTTLANCLEDAENTNGNYVFVQPQKSSTNNDNLIVVSP